MSTPHSRSRSRPLLYTPLPFRTPHSLSSYLTLPPLLLPPPPLPFLPIPTHDSSSSLPRHSLFPLILPLTLSPILPPNLPDPQAAIMPYQGVTSTKPSWTLQEPPATSSIFPTQILTPKKRGENVFHASAVLPWCSTVLNYFL
jgi:hypothetical protein